ncbi:helix-turn-helix domain-containing protein [Ruminococcus sp.]|uniref:helix-turn-helix domain-containing protein n=1 Tax=Ruminococcus sp. TaxID=41978 RepID=UPI003FEF8EFB
MIGDTLKRLRTKKGLTSEELCSKIGIKGGSYRNYERNDRKPDYDTLVKLADFYGVTTDYLLGRPDAKEPADPIASLPTVDEMEKDLFREWLDLDEASRKAFLDVLRKIVADDQKRQAEDSRSKIMTVKEAARSDEPGNAPHTADYPQALLDEMDKNAPRTDINT